MLVRLICAGNAVARLIPWHGLKLRSKKSTENRAFASGGDMRGYYLAAKFASTAWHSPLRSSLVWRVTSPRWPRLISRLTSIGFYRIRVAEDRQPCNDILAGRLLHLAPLRRSDAHVALEGTLERRFGLIPDRLRHGTGRKRRFLQLVRGERHPDVDQEIAGRSSELLLELPRERGPRHVAQARKLGQRPCARGLVEQSGHRRCQAGMTGKRKETSWRVLPLAGEPHHEREHGRRQRVQHGAAAETIVRGLTPHQGDEASELRGSFLLSSVSTGMHDQAQWQIAAQQAIVRGCDREVSAQQIESFFRTEIFADREVEG